VLSVAKFNTEGAPDGASNVVINQLDPKVLGGAGNTTAVDGSGRIIVVGRADTSTGSDFFVAALTSAGGLDGGFGVGGVAFGDFTDLPNEARALAIGADGTIFVAGGATAEDRNLFGLARFSSDGKADEDFGINGVVQTPLLQLEDGRHSVDVVHAMAIDPAGNIILAGSSLASFIGDFGTVIGLQRYTADGILDDSFDFDGAVRFDVPTPAVTTLGDKAYSVVINNDGRILVGGMTDGPIANSDTFVLLRFNPNGSRDAEFGGSDDGIVRTYFGGLTSALISDMAIQSDGAILAGGNVFTCRGEGCGEGTNAFAVSRYDASGKIDPSFGDWGLVLTQQFAGGRPQNNLATLAIQPDADGNPTLALGSWVN